MKVCATAVCSHHKHDDEIMCERDDVMTVNLARKQHALYLSDLLFDFDL